MIVCADTVVDAVGNVYQAVRIGNQIWTTENFRSTRDNDGLPINEIKDSANWAMLGVTGYCFYNNTTNVDSIRRFGALYNWHTVTYTRFAPTGWHVPSDSEWAVLEKFMVRNGYNWDGTTDTSARNKIAKALAANFEGKTSSSAGAIGNNLALNNRSGFSALPAGVRYGNNEYDRQGEITHFWSTTESDYGETHACSRILYYASDYISRFDFEKTCGFSVRLVKD